MSPPRRTFGATWWGKAWVDALEGRARLDPNRLPRGRTYARQDRAGPVTITSGSASAKVSGSRPMPYSVEVRVRTFTEDETARVVAAIAAKAAHAAALLDGEIEPGVLDDVRGAGVDLLPGPGEIGPRCSCPDWADPCKHAAAVCYLVADAVDADPFALFHLRGLPRERLLAAVREHRRAAGTDAAGTGSPTTASASASPDGRSPARRRARTTSDAAVGVGGIRRAGSAPTAIAARDVFAAAQPDAAAIWALALPAPPPRPGRPPPAAVDPPRSSALDAADLQALAADAAERAWQLVRGDADSGLALPVEHDLARRAAPLLGTSAFAELAARAEVSSRFLVTLALAWRLGGADAVTVTTEPWSPEAGALDEGRAALTAALGIRPSLAVDGRLADDPIDDDNVDWDDEDDWDEDDDDDWDEDEDEDEDGDDRDDDDGPGSHSWRRPTWRARPPRPTSRARPPVPPAPRVTARNDRVSAGAVQLRLSRSGSWFRFAKVDDQWEIVAGPQPDAATLFADLGNASAPAGR